MRAGADPTARNADGLAPLDKLSRFKDQHEQQALGWELANTCGICKKDIVWYKLLFRHHCRFCLKSMCGWCSNGELDGHRICDSCKGGEGEVEETHRLKIAVASADREEQRLQLLQIGERRRHLLVKDAERKARGDGGQLTQGHSTDHLFVTVLVSDVGPFALL